MFSTLPYLAHNTTQASYYAPQISSPLSSPPLRSSPLSPRNGNTSQAPRRRFPMSSPTPTKNRKENPYSQRITRSNPLIHSRGDGQESRRKLFLKKIKEGSEDKRWAARGGEDEMMRMIWVAEEKRRAERQAMEASCVAMLQEENLDENLEGTQPQKTQDRDDDMVDIVAEQEEAEIEALLSMLEEENSSSHHESNTRPETPYGSDDDEYDYIFLDVINEEYTSNSSQQHAGDKTKTDCMMDIS